MAGPTIRELAERDWQGDGDLVHQHHPVQPVGDRVAEELDHGLLYVKSVAAATTIDSGDGLVMLDTGGPFDRDVIHDQVRAWRPDAPLAAAIFSHHHIDHIFGTTAFEAEATDRRWPRPQVYGHEAMAAHLDRYLATQGWNTAINQRQFGLPVEGFAWPDAYRYPDITYHDRLVFARGGLTLELRHARGETDDATWTWIPERKLLAPGDLFIWAVPNAGNPQKVQRYLSDWAVALREMAALGAEVMIPGHGLPVFGAGRITEALTDTADLLDAIETQTLAIMNAGRSLDTALHEVEVPARLQDKPWLRPVYDHPQFLVRNVWRRYGGWHDGEPDRLLPAPRAQEAAEWLALAGGVEPVLDRARALAEAGDLRVACHLVEAAVVAEPGSTAAHALRAEVYRARAEQQESSMARNLMRHAAESSERGQRDLAGDF